jgi:hypothetical protein
MRNCHSIGFVERRLCFSLPMSDLVRGARRFAVSPGARSNPHEFCYLGDARFNMADSYLVAERSAYDAFG